MSYFDGFNQSIHLDENRGYEDEYWLEGEDIYGDEPLRWDDIH